MTARDVRYSFEYVLQNPNSQCRWMLTPIRGGRALASGEASELEGFQILSATEFLIHLDQPLSFFPALLAYPGIGIFPEGTRHFNGSWREGCVGTGPFRVIRFDQGRRLELEANPDYWQKGFPKSEGLIFTFGVPPQEILAGFRTGRYSVVSDLLPSDVDALRHEAEFASGYRDTPRLCTYYLALNLHKAPLSDDSIRHRLIRNVDVESLVRRTIGRLAIPAHGLIPPGLLGYEPRKRRNSGSAKKSESAQNIELVCATHTLFDGPYAAFTKELFRSFQDNGFSIRTTETKAEYSKYPVIVNNVDLAMTRWIGDYTDPDTFFSGLLHSERGLVAAFCSTPEMDQLIDRGRRETHPQLRHEIYQQAEQMIVQRAIVFPLFHEQTYRFFRPEVEGFELRFTSTQVVAY
ncbi:MAG TPA: ABC transporter substrate-binding protein, partial [Acidobacteriota bacterium]